MKRSPFICILAAITFACIAHAAAGETGADPNHDQDGPCEDRQWTRGKPLAYCGDLPSLARINIRNAVLEEVYRIQDELVAEMDSAVEFAMNSPYPDPSKVDQDIYA